MYFVLSKYNHPQVSVYLKENIIVCSNLFAILNYFTWDNQHFVLVCASQKLYWTDMINYYEAFDPQTVGGQVLPGWLPKLEAIINKILYPIKF